jgi:chromosomal replication initiation ATPase DnaA
MSGHYAYLVERRDTILATARMSDTAKTRALGLATAVSCPDPAARAQAEVVRLIGENEGLRATVERLTNERAGLIEQMRVVNEGAHQARIATRRVLISDVQSAFCEEYATVGGLIYGRAYTLVDLCSVSRSRQYAWPRMVCMVLVRKLCHVSLPVIAKAFNRDHTTVMNALRKVAHMTDDPRLAAAHDRVVARFTVRS